MPNIILFWRSRLFGRCFDGLSRLTLLKRFWRSDSILLLGPLFSIAKNVATFFDTQALMRSQFWPESKIIALQIARMRALLSSAQHIPFWKVRFSEAGIDPPRLFGTAEIRKLPILTRAELQRHDLSVLIHPQERVHIAIADHTSGSTGRPLRFVLDRHYELRSFSICERMFRAAGGGERVPVITVRARARIGFAAKRGYWFYSWNYNSLRHRIHDLISLAAPLRSRFVLYGFGSSLVELARLRAETGADLSPRAVISAGESLSSEQRNYLKRHLSADVFSCYSTRELGWLAYECDAHNLHTNPEWAYFEVVDEGGVPLPPGKEGRIIITTFDNLIMPFIRYDTGDRGTLSAFVECSCGRTSPLLRVNGRQVEFIHLPDGRKVPFLDVFAIFDRFYGSIERFQVIQKSVHEIRVKIVPASPLFDRYKEGLRSDLQRILHPRVTISVESVSEIAAGPNGKAVYFKPLSEHDQADH